ncbi:MAG: 50S ribosomal protein L30 [Synergistaceae bacterium]|nr:50S ribosomal protein L30 [Synergistota bacterium]NLM71938.1 50S ribosomal protein L30 [Synergistaceae bacterium]
MAKVRITWKRSAIRRPAKQGRIVRALGLRKLNQTVEHERTPQIMGMVNKVRHLVECVEVED